MGRAIGTSFLIVLLNCTLMFGGCVSCPRFFMFPGTVADCCKAGKCERSHNLPIKRDCKRMAFAPAGQQDVHVDLSFAPGTPPLKADLSLPAVALMVDTDPVEHSPPDLIVLNSSFLI